MPNGDDGTVDVINPKTYRVTARYRTGESPHHVTPAWDLRRLYVDNTASGTLTVIDPRSGRPVRTIALADSYNLYFTPDGREDVVVAERERRLDFPARRNFRMRASDPSRAPGLTTSTSRVTGAHYW